MRITFITGSLEPGKDGVGDYTRFLAEECLRQGHQSFLIALNDPFITQHLESELIADILKIPILRLPSNMPWQARVKCAKKFLHSFNSDWVSLQFVPYSFHPKGIIAYLDKRLSRLTCGRKVHIMFHEIWIGQHKKAPLKERFIGSIQKFFIMRLVKQLKPSIIHTSNSTYIALLKQQSISADRLSLFGNIPVTEKSGDSWLFPELENVGLNITAANRNKVWLVGFFGVLHPPWPAEPLFGYLAQAAKKHNRKIAIISIGRLGYGENKWKEITQAYSPQFTFLRLGEQSAEKISQFFNSIDYGIAATPYDIIGKSGPVAAMLEHGLPVIVNRQDSWRHSIDAALEDDNKLLCKMDPDLPDRIIHLNREPKKPKLTMITEQFISDLTRNMQ